MKKRAKRPKEYRIQEWACTQCGGEGRISLPIDVEMEEAATEVECAHKSKSGWCDGDARTCWRIRPFDCPDEHWEHAVRTARANALSRLLANTK
jgi:hypothetical protein